MLRVPLLSLALHFLPPVIYYAYAEITLVVLIILHGHVNRRFDESVDCILYSTFSGVQFALHRKHVDFIQIPPILYKHT